MSKELEIKLKSRTWIIYPVSFTNHRNNKTDYGIRIKQRQDKFIQHCYCNQYWSIEAINIDKQLPKMVKEKAIKYLENWKRNEK